MDRCTALESAQVLSQGVQAEGWLDTATALTGRVNISADTMGGHAAAAAWRDDRDFTDEAVPGTSQAVNVPRTSGGFSGESSTTHYTQPGYAAWPWAPALPSVHANPTPYMATHTGGPSTAWLPGNAIYHGWGMPHAFMPPAPTSSIGISGGTMQHPSVPPTGYNSVPLAALPYGDYSTPLGDHLTPVVKEKI